MTREEIINNIRKEGLNIGKNDVLIGIMPTQIQSIALAYHRYENYVPDFFITSLLSAAATAIGNSFRLRIKGLWTTNSALYIVLFGKPGLGKTPPIEAAYLPIRKLDEERLRQYLEEKKLYDSSPKEGKTALEKPMLIQTVVSDFTVEALLQAHFCNLDGVTAVCDEIMGLIYSAERYNKSNLIEVLLTAFSGGQLNVIRRSSDTPIFIKMPCINIIGTTQTALLSQLSDKWMNNGFLDRVIFIHPQDSTIAPWVEEDETTLEQSAKAKKDWETIVKRIYKIKQDNQQIVLSFTPDAKSRFFAWQNSIISSVNAVTDETKVETREMKRCLITAKLALIIQILRHVCGEADKDAVDIASVESAIIANEYYEESYEYFKQAIGLNNVNNSKKSQFVSMCIGDFSTSDAQQIGRQLDVNERTVKRWLKDLSEKGIFERIEHGRYRHNV